LESNLCSPICIRGVYRDNCTVYRKGHTQLKAVRVYDLLTELMNCIALWGNCRVRIMRVFVSRVTKLSAAGCSGKDLEGCGSGIIKLASQPEITSSHAVATGK